MFTVVALSLVMPATFLISDSSQAVEPISLGAADGFAILAGGAFTNGVDTNVLGNIGESSGTVTGISQTGNSYVPADAEYTQAMTGLQAVHTAAESVFITTTVITASPTTFTPGSYYQAAALAYAAAANLTFDAGNDPDAVFLIRTDGALSIGANATVTYANGASADNVYWHVTGATTIAADVDFAGTVITNGAISVGADSTVRGRLLSINGAVAVGARSKIFSYAPPVITLSASTMNLAGADSYAILAGGALTNGLDTNVLGDIGESSGAFTSATQTGNSYVPADAEYTQAMTGLQAVHTAAESVFITTTVITASPTTFTPGSYYQAAALAYAAAANLTFDAGNDPDAVFLIRTDGALSIGANATVTYANGASADNVYWHVTGATTIAADVDFAGTVITNGAISVGADSTVRGRLLSINGAVAVGARSKIFSYDAVARAQAAQAARDAEAAAQAAQNAASAAAAQAAQASQNAASAAAAQSARDALAAGNALDIAALAALEAAYALAALEAADALAALEAADLATEAEAAKAAAAEAAKAEAAAAATAAAETEKAALVQQQAVAAEAEEVRVYGPKSEMTFAPTPSLLEAEITPPLENVVLQIAVVPAGPIAGGDASRAAQY